MSNTEITHEPMRELTPEEQAQLEAEAAKNREKALAPYKEACEQRKNSAAIIAEHDNLLAEVLFEITMNAIGEV